MIQKERIRALNDCAAGAGKHILYWMQSAQRTRFNHALEFAIFQANERKLPLLVFFGITENYPAANKRHYLFMLEGLRDVRDDLAKRGIPFVVRVCRPDEGAALLAREAALVITDDSCLREPRSWRARAAEKMPCPLIQVETNLIVPVAEASPKEEYAAATIRPKILRKLDYYLAPLKEHKLQTPSLNLSEESFNLDDPHKALRRLKLNGGAQPSPFFKGGAHEARKRLKQFVDEKLEGYDSLRNNPALDALSNVSPYLHFGQISPLEIALKVRERGGASAAAYLEELIIRRELASNFTYYNPAYDSFEALPDWARKTLREHASDKRFEIYSREEFECAQTRDPYWNAAQEEMLLTGKMHGYMRMYWGKKIIEWSPSPQAAFETALYLNDKYELDGRDPNGYAGVAWCFGKHDRPWSRRPIFGSIRYMNAAGLRRKFDPDAYVEKVKEIRRQTESSRRPE